MHTREHREHRVSRISNMIVAEGARWYSERQCVPAHVLQYNSRPYNSHGRIQRAVRSNYMHFSLASLFSTRSAADSALARLDTCNSVRTSD